MDELQGKVVLITGASRGIGKALAEGFARTGAKVCCGARHNAQVAATAAGINAAGGEAMHHPCDVTELQSVDKFFAAAQARFGGIDIVIVNSGLQAEGKTVEEGDPANWKAIIDTNLIGAYYTMRCAIPYLRQRGGGKMITIGSGAGRRALPRSSAYACSKAGLWMLTRAVAQEVAADNISVNELIPGPVDTDMLRSGISAANIEQLRGIEWFKQPEDLLPMVMFLATHPDPGPTGQTYSLARREF